jgi:hypothetical protein
MEKYSMKFDVDDSLMTALTNKENDMCRVHQKAKKQQLS